MRHRRLLAAALVSCSLLAASARAETKVEIKNVHLCCRACVNAVDKVLKAEGVQGGSDQKAKTVTITAADDKAAQKVIDALAAAGFHGTVEQKDLKVKEDSGVTAGKVKSLTLTGVHNCCPACTKSIKAAIKNVTGATADTVKSREDTFEVTGDFDAAELVKALNDAGFHVKVKK